MKIREILEQSEGPSFVEQLDQFIETFKVALVELHFELSSKAPGTSRYADRDAFVMQFLREKVKRLSTMANLPEQRAKVEFRKLIRELRSLHKKRAHPGMWAQKRTTDRWYHNFATNSGTILAIDFIFKQLKGTDLVVLAFRQ